MARGPARRNRAGHDATRPEVLADAHLERARLLVVAAPDAFQTRAILDLARRVNADLEIVARTLGRPKRAYALPVA